MAAFRRLHPGFWSIAIAVVVMLIVFKPAPYERGRGGDAAFVPAPEFILYRTQPRPLAQNTDVSFLIENGKRGDPRLLDRAEAALLRLPADDALRQYGLADLDQYRHRYSQALQRLDSLLQRDSTHLNARLMRSNIYTVQGAYSKALRDCVRLTGHVQLIVATACVAQVKSRSGKLPESYALLAATASRWSPDTGRPTRIWVYALLAEMAQRMDRPAQAQHWLERALLLDSGHRPNFHAWIEHQIRQRRCGAAAARLQAWPDPDPEKSIALFRCGKLSPDGLQRLHAFMRDLALLRSTDERLWVQYEMHVTANKRKALRHALENWRNQKEPEDIRLLWQSAAEASDAHTLDELRRWIDQTRYQDRMIESLATFPEGA